MATTERRLDTAGLSERVRGMYQEVALHPDHDSFLAALAAGERGSVIGIDMTAEQLTKATDLAAEAGISNVEFREGLIEDPQVEPGSIDCVPTI
jgi:hypothetical protein